MRPNISWPSWFDFRVAAAALLFAIMLILAIGTFNTKSAKDTANSAKTQGNKTLACLTSPALSATAAQRCLNIQAAKNGQPGRTGAPGPRGERGPVGQPWP